MGSLGSSIAAAWRYCVTPTGVLEPHEQLKIVRLTSDATSPTRGSADCAGYDLCSAVTILLPGALAPIRHITPTVYSSDEKTWPEVLTAAPGRFAIPTHIAVQIPKGYYGRIASRSSCALRGLDVAAGVIDSDYRGEVKIILVNYTHDIIKIQKGERIAQLIIEKITTPPVVEYSDITQFTNTQRGAGGFGSTN